MAKNPEADFRSHRMTDLQPLVRSSQPRYALQAESLLHLQLVQRRKPCSIEAQRNAPASCEVPTSPYLDLIMCTRRSGRSGFLRGLARRTRRQATLR